MSVWLTIPSARPPEEAERVLKLWRERGYKIALYCDPEPEYVVARSQLAEHITITEHYPGYGAAVNTLIRKLSERDPEAEWFICAGDDTEPDPNHSAEEIAKQCTGYFAAVNRFHHAYGILNEQTPAKDIARAEEYAMGRLRWQWPPYGYEPQGFDTFGVCQPTGDRFAGGSIDRICGSPWIGRDFARRMYGGNGPYWPEYRHMFVDEELQEVALKMGVLWQRRDLVHLHRHFARESDSLNSRAVMKPIPVHLVESNSPAHWTKYKNIFTERKRLGFPGHEPIA